MVHYTGNEYIYYTGNEYIYDDYVFLRDRQANIRVWDMSAEKEHAAELPSPEGVRDDDVHPARDTPPHPGALRRILSFFDSTTKVLLAVGGLVAAATGLWAALSHIDP